MAKDRSYEMGCNCPKNLFWCDGSCENFSNEPENEPEENKNFFFDKLVPIVIGIIVIAILTYIVFYWLPYPEKLRPVLF